MVPEKQLTQFHHITGNYRSKQEELRLQHGIYSAASCTKLPPGLHWYGRFRCNSYAISMQFRCNPW